MRGHSAVQVGHKLFQLSGKKQGYLLKWALPSPQNSVEFRAFECFDI